MPHYIVRFIHTLKPKKGTPKSLLRYFKSDTNLATLKVFIQVSLANNY